MIRVRAIVVGDKKQSDSCGRVVITMINISGTNAKIDDEMKEDKLL